MTYLRCDKLPCPADGVFVTTKDAIYNVRSGKHIQKSMIESGWRPAPGKKHPKWKKEVNGVTMVRFISPAHCHSSSQLMLFTVLTLE